jgi:hypothetical protein
MARQLGKSERDRTETLPDKVGVALAEAERLPKRIDGVEQGC